MCVEPRCINYLERKLLLLASTVFMLLL